MGPERRPDTHRIRIDDTLVEESVLVQARENNFHSCIGAEIGPPLRLRSVCETFGVVMQPGSQAINVAKTTAGGAPATVWAEIRLPKSRPCEALCLGAR